MTERDRGRHQRIPLTSPSRTLLDLASILRPGELEGAIAEAQAKNLVRTTDVADQLARNQGRPGTPSLRALVLDGAPSLTRSEAERRLLQLIRSADLPSPETNVDVGGYEVDFVWREASLVVEVDGYAFHRGRRAFEQDRRRDAELVALGHTVIRVTWRQLVDEPHAVIARIAAAIALASG